MEKALTLDELIENLTRAREAFPELGDKPVVFLDQNNMPWKVTEGVYDAYRDHAGNYATVVIG